MLKSYNEAISRFSKEFKGKKTPLDCFEFLGYQSLKQSFDKIQNNWTQKIDYKDITQNKDIKIIVVDVHQKIIFASENVSEMNGYFNSEIMGKSPKMFQGNETDQNVTNKIRLAIIEKKPFKEVLLNYRKDGQTYLCTIEAYPKFNEKGELINYIAFEKAA